jgi:hypothetical protein
MPREQLLGLASDADRLLAAGAAAAIDNEGLIRRSKTLRELGKKVPALLPVADTVDRVVKSEPRQVGAAFLDLIGTARQLRASLAGSGVPGELEPVAASGPWSTPLPVRELRPLHEAVTTRGVGREVTLREAAQRGVFGDMRLAPILINALNDGYAAVADMVADQILPSLGKAVLPELLSGLDLDGKASDARRLRAICKIDRDVGAGLCRRALDIEEKSYPDAPEKRFKTRSGPVRAQAVQSLPEVLAPEEAERIALSLIDDRSMEIRAAALSALRASRSDAALETLLQAVQGDRDHLVMAAAQQALASLPHPQTTARLIQVLEAAAAGARAKPDKSKTAAQNKAERDRCLNHAIWLTATLAQRKSDADRLAAARALLPLARMDEALSYHAINALVAIGPVTDEVLPLFTDALTSNDRRDYWLVMQALPHFLKAYPEAMAPMLRKHLEAKKIPNNVREILERMLVDNALK